MAFVYSKNFNIFTKAHYFYFVKGIIICTVIFTYRFIFKLYNVVWRYANYNTYFLIVISDIFAALTNYVIGLIFETISFNFNFIFVISATYVLCFLVSRFVYQILYSYKNKLSELQKDTNKLNKINIAIVGAGNVGASLVEILKRNPKAHYNPYCFIDSDKQKVGKVIDGLKVYYDDDKIIEKIKKLPIQEIIIAITDLEFDKKKALFDKYKQTNCKIKLYEYPTSDKSLIKGMIRELKIEDLLFRDALKFNTDKTKMFYNDKVVLVTGGGGSIGSEICRQVAKQKPKKLAILDIYENNAYEVQQELLNKYGSDINLEVYIASVRDADRLDYIFNKLKPEIVIHAAAHKHVPLMENNAPEVVKNNVIGTYNTANMAEKYGVERFILISTDKAVNPTNVMGASKRLCEMVVQCRKDSNTTQFIAVRFGNVLGSNGSVIPLFRKQIEKGGPITITDKRIIRYFMTIPEATQLVLEAGSIAKNGELFVLDMGKPVKIIDLAENMIRLSGLTPYIDIDIQEIGLRPGEKLYEELLMKNEELDKTENEMIFIERDKSYTRKEIEEKLEILLKAVENGDNESIKKAIRLTVPTYIAPEVANSKLEEII